MTSDSNSPAIASLLTWLSTHVQFPRSRLPEKAELMLLMSVCAAAEDEEANTQRGPLQRRDGARDSAMRAHAMRRSLVHYRCDNSAKV